MHSVKKSDKIRQFLPKYEGINVATKVIIPGKTSKAILKKAENVTLYLSFISIFSF